MMNDLSNVQTLLGFFGPIGWQEMVILACPLMMAAIVVLAVLFFTGVIGGNKSKRG